MSSVNAYFKIVHIDDGVYLKLFPAKGKGKQFNMNEIKSYLFRHEIYEFSQHTLKNAVDNNEEAEIKLPVDSSFEVNEEVVIHKSVDNMVATAKFYAPSEGGSMLTMEIINKEMARVGIVVEPNYELINTFLETRNYTEDYVIAKGIEPIEGRDAEIEYKFRTDKSFKPKVNDDGTVDFHNIDIINNVSEGELLARLSPCVEGIDGVDITGRTVKCGLVKHLTLKFGKNIVVSPDGNELYSAVDGHVFLAKDTVNVSTVFEIDSDVDMSTGDIKCKGDVIVKGSVLTGFTVEADGNITVEGVVEGAILKAKGNIIIKRGIQGMKRGTISAGGNIAVKFIENAFVSAEGNVITETIMHSKVTALGYIQVLSNKGFVVGGIIRSAKEILCRTAGSVMETHTTIQIGKDIDSEEELKKIERKITKSQLEQEDCLKVLRHYKYKLENGSYMNKDSLYIVKELIAKEKELASLIEASIVQYDSLKKYLENENFQNGSVIIQGDICVGVKIIISGVIHYVRKESYSCKFVREHADIVSYTIGKD